MWRDANGAVQRRLLIALLAMSIVGCVAVSALWARSYWVHEGWNWQRHWPGVNEDGSYHLRAVRSVDRRFWFATEDSGYPFVISAPFSQGYVRVDSRSGPTLYVESLNRRHALGFEYMTMGRYVLVIAVPYWFLELLTATASLLALLGRRSIRRSRAAPDRSLENASAQP